MGIWVAWALLMLWNFGIYSYDRVGLKKWFPGARIWPYPAVPKQNRSSFVKPCVHRKDCKCGEEVAKQDMQTEPGRNSSAREIYRNLIQIISGSYVGARLF